MLPSILILSALVVIAFAVTIARPISESELLRQDAARSLALAVCAQSIHFVEEAVAGLHERLPEMFGLSAMPFSIFVLLNVAWLAIWSASIPGLRSGRTGACFAAWFLAVAGLFNGVAHPLLAVASRGYFPGVVTSPLVGCASALLWIRMCRATRQKGLG